jgi:hypothetical protein
LIWRASPLLPPFPSTIIKHCLSVILPKVYYSWVTRSKWTFFLF